MKNISQQILCSSRKNEKIIHKLTAPLKKFLTIDRFWRSFQGENGTHNLITNSLSIAEIFYEKKLYKNHLFFRHPRFFRTGFLLPEQIGSPEYEITQGRLRIENGCHHVLVYIQKQPQGFVEYGFALSEPRPGFESVYLNHLKAIQYFIGGFEQNAAQIIRENEDYVLPISNLIGTVYQEPPQIPEFFFLNHELSFLTALEGDRAVHLQSLTRCEKECLRFYLKGYTTLEISKIRHRSSRTIETHLERAKEKLGVTSRFDLMKLLNNFREFF